MAEGLAKRLQLKRGMAVLVINAPDGYAARLRADFAHDAVHTLDERPGGKAHFEAVQLFTAHSGDLESYYNTAHAALAPDALFWIAYPKQSSGVATDLTRDAGWARVTSDGWEAVRMISLDDTWSAVRFKHGGVITPDAQVEAQYSGAKAELRPIYNYVVEIVQGLGDDVQITPRRSYVAFGRRTHFAAIAASARDRVDLALKLKDRPFDDLLQENTGIGGGALTHKLALRSTMDVDDRVVALLRAACAAAG